MGKWKEYKKIEFPGSMLKPSFSVYLFEIVTPQVKYFYVGMTGDGFYPSARSAVHRFSGHFERNARSTQNQMSLALNKQKDISLENIKIIMHHWPIKGFQAWEYPLKDFKPSKLKGKDKKSYEDYQDKQKKILQLEQYLITKVKNKIRDRCLNDTSKQQLEFDPAYKVIIADVNKIVK